MKSKIWLCGVFVMLFAGCSGNKDGGDDIFIANVSNAWNSSRSSTFIFNPDKTGVNESNFTGQELDNSNNDNEFSGSFKNYDIHFKFTSGNDAGVTYTGKFVKGSDPLKMQLKGTNGVSLTITKQVQNN